MQDCGIVPGQPLIQIQADGKLQRIEGDYRNPQHYQPGSVVEKSHFTFETETTISGVARADLSYTLRRFPNHHRALYAMMRNQQVSTDRAEYSMDCYFRRAIYFAPDDEIVHMLYGMFYQEKSELEKSKEEYLIALNLKPNDAQINYNLALLYFEIEDYDAASKHAQIAYDAGHPLPGLRNKLESVKSSEHSSVDDEKSNIED